MQIGGPSNAPRGFLVVGSPGAPTPPPAHVWYFNDGPAPGHPPPNWVGPPPGGSWDGPPPAGGWNRPWDRPGPVRDIVRAQRDFAAFAFNNFVVIPVFNFIFGGFGYWYFGIWMPLFY